MSRYKDLERKKEQVTFIYKKLPVLFLFGCMREIVYFIVNTTSKGASSSDATSRSMSFCFSMPVSGMGK